jgi:Transposase IS66 family
VKRIDVLFAIEREINGLAQQKRLRVRQERGHPLITELQSWLREQRAKLSRNNDTTKAIITASAAGMHSSASSMTGAFACRTTPPNASYGRSP